MKKIIISYFMIEKCIPNLEIHLYPDNDQSDYKMNWIVKNYAFDHQVYAL